jgi:hypothetical protein
MVAERLDRSHVGGLQSKSEEALRRQTTWDALPSSRLAHRSVSEVVKE